MVVAPVAAVGVDGVFAEDFAGVLVDDGDGAGVDEDGHRLTFVGGADAEVVHPAGAAEADLAEAVDVVVADPVVRIAALSGWGGFDGGGVGLGWGGAVQCPVGSDLVVDVGEGVELGLQLGDGGGGWLGGEAGVSGFGGGVRSCLGFGDGRGGRSLGDAEAGQQVFEAVAAAGEAGGVDRPVEFLTDVKLRRLV